MEEEKQRIYTVVAIIVVVGLLFSCVAAAVAGGVAGFMAGRRQGKTAAERLLASELDAMRAQEELLVPEPDLEELIPPLEMVPSGMEGALIREVIAGSPAADAGLEAGDIITAIDQNPVDRDHSLPDVIGEYQPGDRVSVHVWRAGKEDTVLAELEKHPDNPAQAYLGVYFAMIQWRRDISPGD